ncbi:AAA family ATPase [Salinarchaeum sp. IM2453]|uniref:archaea-specific SMC-related protein n=1 Tax=Salinarchaeum sp. IM2453 TaxID=2862870 RepID=UPI001C828F07|nr:archaea-specific SMC-related protein [Salinarchaeum sp. IM2453]QZA87999.1 AAA family ATPase [Salinarchaeum sp. IM2453]
MWSLTINNIAGIQSGSATIDSGLNVVQASNFRGKSSFTAAVRVAIGATGYYEDHPLTEGENKGNVNLSTSGDQYDVHIERTGDTCVRSGNPYLSTEENQIAARLFAFLGEDNPIRYAVRHNEDLTELLQAPLDIEDIDAKINELQNSRSEIQSQLSEARMAADKIPELEKQQTTLQDELESLRDTQSQFSATEETKQRAEDLSEELTAKQEKLEITTQRIKRLEQQIERKQSTLSEKRAKLTEIDIQDKPTLSTDLETKQNKINSLDRKITLAEDLHRANRNILEEEGIEVIADVEHTVVDDEIECWVCGSGTLRDTIENKLDSLQNTIDQLRDQKSQLETEIKQYKNKKREYEEKQRRQEQLERTVSILKAEIDDLQGQLDTAQAQKSALQQEVDKLKNKLEAVEREYNDKLATVKTKIRSKERKLQSIEEKLSNARSREQDINELRKQEREITDTIETLRKRKTETQYEIKRQFDTAIKEIVDRFDPGFDGAHLNLKTDPSGEIESIELQIARDGRETSLNALSEGEVELVGLVVALAGYRTYDVNEHTPVLIVDGVGELAAEHLRTLLSYLAETSEIIITTAYPEAGSFDGNIINPASWNVVSDSKASSA